MKKKKLRIRRVLFLILSICIMIALVIVFIFHNKSIDEHIVIVKNKTVLHNKASSMSKKVKDMHEGMILIVDAKNGSYYHGYGYSHDSYIEGYIDEEDVVDYIYDNKFEKKIKSFPNSYKQPLRYLHTLHPKWVFESYPTSLKFKPTAKIYNKKALTQETDKSLIRSENIVEGSTWRKAGLKLTQYALDPRNGLLDKYALMYEVLEFNDNDTIDDALSMLEGTFMTGYEDTSDKNWEDMFYEAAKMYNISLSNIISRAKQEQGTSGGIGAKGKEIEGKTYYNIFNIGANSGANQGMEYAYKKDWDTIEKSIHGGVSYLAEKYIQSDQDTLYFQRFDIMKNPLGNHVYMTNILAPYSESYHLYKDYQYLNTLNKKRILHIPIYQDIKNINYPNSLITQISTEDTTTLKNIKDTDITLESSSTIKVTYKNKELRENIDFIIKNMNNEGSYLRISIQGINNYYGKIEKELSD